MATRRRVLILGGGFAGLHAARGLSRAPVDIWLVDRRNHHVFQPLLYQVATASLSSIEIASPLRRIFRRQRNVEVRLGDAEAVLVDARRVRFADGELPYDHLVIATGATHGYFGHSDWERFAPGLKTIEDALEIRRRILLAYERAENETDEAAQRAWLTFVIVGAGPTGVELAGALAEIARRTLVGDFRRIDPRRSRVVLVEGEKRVLPGFPADLSAHAQSQLERLGVEVRTGVHATAIDASGVLLGAERLPARTVLWAAGVAASPLARTLGVPLDRAGRVLVEPDLSVPGHPEIQVVGDLAALAQDGRPIPGVAQAAIQEGRHAARNIERALRGQPALPFRYHDPGTLATIGRRAAVAELGRLHLWGFPAWVAWLTVHLYFLVGFRNRLIVLFEWALAYFTNQRSARLILGDEASRREPPSPADRATP
jgi:NADH dehydrogenase